ncbi:4-(cytidine 5'-diphospho)-2-C-methyl-D-erythritol kinase [Parasulfuritortus cantonensis]|uniref:4-diphosphocytidyl-2-C-methyl-D-erythritol kinase n=1 Tax=Parasulfuritortus cantonensis TaxID=2528202 RepID=A0A4R1B6N4_9PROT|nr:4-(cytidine 5'-diphospho)-2-C-methyl-D-erythritol kinase [Parasulfuritortus cantonensis]TCJ12387.1 4-(cytidine 5'-diphospho)-2-C-methyl-D-erythritol kinase [Parasulfuritortus cantonensis]
MNAFPAPAKLNLFLHVVGRRPDGYHLLQTVFRFLDYGDTVHIAPRADGDIRLLTPLPGVPEHADLCFRAASLLREHTGCRLGADIRLEKHLPMGGGLGGGSSDAATVLMALNRLWRLDLPRAELQALGLRLGADVPVFVFGRSAFAEGVGERLRAVSLAPASYVVLVPPVQVATATIFSHPGLTRDTPELKIPPLSGGHNDLEPVALVLYPVIGEYLRWLGRYGDARMTGSGACVFAAFAGRAEAEAVFGQRPEGMKGFVADGLDVHPMYDGAGSPAG